MRTKFSEAMAYMRAVVEGICDADAGRTLTLKQAKKRLGLGRGGMASQKKLKGLRGKIR